MAPKVPLHYFPDNSVFLFSTNAFMPSFWSAACEREVEILSLKGEALIELRFKGPVHSLFRQLYSHGRQLCNLFR